MSDRAVATRRPPYGWRTAVLLGALAFVVRWLASGGLAGLRSERVYDDGVYYAAAASLLHGVVPYRDVLLLHPPGIVLALSPFALLGSWAGDAVGYESARIAFMLVGALNTVLVTRLAQRWGARAGVVGGVLYAFCAVAAISEGTTLLEPLGALSLLGGVLLLVRSAEAGAARWVAPLGAVVLGLGLVVKIWDVVPVLVVLAWQGWRHGWRRGLRLALVAGGTAALVVLPFALAAPGPMFRYVVLDQLGRARWSLTATDRLAAILGVETIPGTAMTGGDRILLAALLAVTLVGALAAWRARRGRVWVVLAVMQLAVLLESPSYLDHYGMYAAPALVLVLAAGSSTLPARRGLRWTGAVAAAACALVVVTTAPDLTPDVLPFPADAVRAQLPPTGCTTADSPGGLALADTLTPDLERGCRVPVDPTGFTYDRGPRLPDGTRVPRLDNPVWQEYGIEYLTSGSAGLLLRPVGDGFDPTTCAALTAGTRVVVVGDVHVLRTGEAPAPGPSTDACLPAPRRR